MRRWSLFAALAFVGCLLALAACGSSTSTGGAVQVATATPSGRTTLGATAKVGATVTAGASTTAEAAKASAASSLPVGDGKLSSSARRGYVYSCSSGSEGGGGAGGGGASSEEPWIHGSTWDPAQKISVKGNVHWSQARLSIKRKGGRRVISTNDLPRGASTGRFPISSSERAYTYDHNPNRIEAQKVKLSLRREPKAAKQPSCLGFGDIGVLKDGVLLFDALDAEGRDAVAHEVQDSCDGHPQQSGIYHYHDVSSCLLDRAKGRSTLVGYALDGYGIYVERNRKGKLLTNRQLDACHGRVSKVKWNGRKVRIYHYVATAEYPYTLGCYHGTPVRSSVGEGGGGGGRQGPPGRQGPSGQGGPPPRP